MSEVIESVAKAICGPDDPSRKKLARAAVIIIRDLLHEYGREAASHGDFSRYRGILTILTR